MSGYMNRGKWEAPLGCVPWRGNRLLSVLNENRWGVYKREKILGNDLMAFSGSIREEATPLLCTIPASSYSWKFIWQLSIYTVFCVKHVSSWFWSAISIIWLCFSFNSNNMSNRFHLLECFYMLGTWRNIFACLTSFHT